MRTWRLPKGQHLVEPKRKALPTGAASTFESREALRCANIANPDTGKAASDRGGNKPGMRSAGKAFRVVEVWGCRQDPRTIGGTSVRSSTIVRVKNTSKFTT